jgi:hypothetical protein
VDRVEKLREALGGAHAGAQEIQARLQEAMGHLPGPDSPPTKEIDLGVLLGLVLMNRHEIPDRIVNLAEQMTDRHGYDRKALQ